MAPRIAIRRKIRHLKRRRDHLLNTACTRQERQGILREVRAINRKIKALEARLHL